MKVIAKWIARLLFGEYRLNRIYRFNLSEMPPPTAGDPLNNRQRLDCIEQSDVELARDERMRDHRWYGGENSYGFGLWEHDELISMTWFWNNRRFQDGGICELAENEVIMVDLLTAESHRGRGLAPILTQFAARELKRGGFETLYTWVWHSHSASIRTFQKAGWTYCAFVTEVNLLHLRRLRFVHRVS